MGGEREERDGGREGGREEMEGDGLGRRGEGARDRKMSKGCKGLVNEGILIITRLISCSKRSRDCSVPTTSTTPTTPTPTIPITPPTIPTALQPFLPYRYKRKLPPTPKRSRSGEGRREGGFGEKGLGGREGVDGESRKLVSIRERAKQQQQQKP